MEELLQKQRKELRDLQSRVTQKKKAATKKTRKGVNDECDTLERQLQEKHARETAILNGEPDPDQELSAAEVTDLQDGAEEQDFSVDHVNNAKDAKVGNGHAVAQPQTVRKPNRQKARLARRAAEQGALASKAAEEASSLPDLRAQERKRMEEHFQKRGLVEQEIRADGHCLFSAVADQMSQLNSALGDKASLSVGGKEGKDSATAGYKGVRHAAADYIARHPEEFEPFLEEPLQDYVCKIRDTGEWGGQLELLALAKSYGVNINVLQADGRTERIEGEDSNDGDEIWLAYYLHGFGLGEHYNSLRRTP